jgi:hypothetical protein
MFLHGCSRDQIFFAKFGFDAAGSKVLLCTISLDAARRAGNTGLGVEDKCLLNCESKIAVAAGRDRSRRVDALMITRSGSKRGVLSPVRWN